MATTIDQNNLYIPSQSISSLTENVDDNRFSRDETNISVNFGTTPATVSIKAGSVIEADGDTYLVETSDFSFQMTNTTDNYVVFDPAVPDFKSASVKGTYNNTKLGVYQTGNVKRTIRWYIDQTEETYNIDDSLLNYNIGGLKTEQNSYIVKNTTPEFILAEDIYTGFSFQTTTTNFLLKKPATFVYSVVSHLALIGFDLDVEFNSTWYQMFNLPTATITQTKFLKHLTPGQYRFVTRYTGLSPGPPSATLTLYMVGVYGQTNFDASSVFE